MCDHITKNQVVGYQVRLESRTSRRTRLLFCTTGQLLQPHQPLLAMILNWLQLVEQSAQYTLCCALEALCNRGSGYENCTRSHMLLQVFCCGGF